MKSFEEMKAAVDNARSERNAENAALREFARGGKDPGARSAYTPVLQDNRMGDSTASQKAVARSNQNERNRAADVERYNAKHQKAEAKNLAKRFGEDAQMVQKVSAYIRECLLKQDWAARIREVIYNSSGDGTVLNIDDDNRGVEWGTGLPAAPNSGTWVLVARDGEVAWEAAEDVTCGV